MPNKQISDIDAQTADLLLLRWAAVAEAVAALHATVDSLVPSTHDALHSDAKGLKDTVAEMSTDFRYDIAHADRCKCDAEFCRER